MMRSEKEVREIREAAHELALSYLASGDDSSEGFLMAAHIDEALAWALNDPIASERLAGIVANLRGFARDRKAAARAQRQ